MNGALDHANNLSEAFDIDIRPILERAADQQLGARKFEDATLLYRLSKVNLFLFKSLNILVNSIFLQITLINVYTLHNYLFFRQIH